MDGAAEYLEQCREFMASKSGVWVTEPGTGGRFMLDANGDKVPNDWHPDLPAINKAKRHAKFTAEQRASYEATLQRAADVGFEDDGVASVLAEVLATTANGQTAAVESTLLPVKEAPYSRWLNKTEKEILRKFFPDGSGRGNKPADWLVSGGIMDLLIFKVNKGKTWGGMPGGKAVGQRVRSRLVYFADRNLFQTLEAELDGLFLEDQRKLELQKVIDLGKQIGSKRRLEVEASEAESLLEDIKRQSRI